MLSDLLQSLTALFRNAPIDTTPDADTPETIQYLHAMLTDHPSMSFGQLAGSLIDARIAWVIERERMSAGVRAAKLNIYGGGALGGRENC